MSDQRLCRIVQGSVVCWVRGCRFLVLVAVAVYRCWIAVCCSSCCLLHIGIMGCRRCRSRSRRASPADTPEPEEAEPKADIPLPMEADDNDEEEEQLPTNRERKASPAAAAADAEDEEAADESPEPAARAGRKRSRSRQPAEPAGATQLVASQALTQRGSAYATQRTLTQIPRMRFPEVSKCTWGFLTGAFNAGIDMADMGQTRSRSTDCCILGGLSGCCKIVSLQHSA